MRATILAGIVALGTRSARATESASQPEGGSATEPASQPEGGAATESAAQPEGGVESVAVADALVVEPGATCLEQDRLTEQVVGWLGADELDPRLTVVVEGDRIEARTLRFTLRDRGRVLAERTFAPGPSRCDDLHAVVALAIALAVDATVLESAGVKAPPVEPPPETTVPEPAPEPVLLETPAPDPTAGSPPHVDLTPRSRPWELRGQLRGLLAYGAPPDVAGGGMVGLELSRKSLIDLQLGLMATSAGARPVDGATLGVTLVGGRLDACAGPRLGEIRPRGCVGMIAGTALAEGRGFSRDFRIALPWVAGTFGADVRVGLTPRLRLSFGLDGLVTVVRPVFDVQEASGARTLRELPRFGALFGLGLVLVLR
ncbi:MAG: hypothetical protein KC501_13370 [Myxococcales bacterium]|nr:hypothetical protein [Myxococcales bacterium]